MINSVREVVGARKDRSVFPIMLAVTKMSGQDTFMGVVRPAEEDRTQGEGLCHRGRCVGLSHPQSLGPARGAACRSLDAVGSCVLRWT